MSEIETSTEPKIEPKTDCFAYSSYGGCTALTVDKCNGDCSFYKNKSEVDIIQIEKDILNYGYIRNKKEF